MGGFVVGDVAVMDAVSLLSDPSGQLLWLQEASATFELELFNKLLLRISRLIINRLTLRHILKSFII